LAVTDGASVAHDGPEARRLSDAAAFMPMTWPELFTNGPPESPGRSRALISITPRERAGRPAS